MAYPCDGDPEYPQGCYSRLCPCASASQGDWPGHDEAALETLAAEMKDSPVRRRRNAAQISQTRTVPSGYVYLGQFIDHDITKDNRYLSEAIPFVEETNNYRTAQFDLESLYGSDPTTVPCLYENDGRLKLGSTSEVTKRNGQVLAASLDDLPRRADGTAIIIDPRNDENLVVAQLQVLFIKFHNRALQLLKDQPNLAPQFAPEFSPDPDTTLFDETRRFVIWHYQWIILHDFLPAIARKHVLADITRPGSNPRLFPQGWYTPANAPISLPVEFSVAAFRFGHSMVREQYILNDHFDGVRSSEIVRMTGPGRGVRDRLPANYVIDWKRFFGWGQTNPARPIAPCITEMLYDLPKEVEFAFRRQQQLGVAAQPPNLDDETPPEGHYPSLAKAPKAMARMMPSLPEMTLKRGSRIQLPGGEEFAREFGFTPLSSGALFPNHEKFLENDLGGRTPLWYYLLREAQVEYSPAGPWINRPQKLGAIGSRIIAETLYQLLKAERFSILNAGRDWKPPPFHTRPAGRLWHLNSICELAQFVAAEA